MTSIGVRRKWNKKSVLRNGMPSIVCRWSDVGESTSLEENLKVYVWRVRTESDDELRLLRRFGFVITVYPKSTAGPNAHEMGVFVVIFGSEKRMIFLTTTAASNRKKMKNRNNIQPKTNVSVL